MNDTTTQDPAAIERDIRKTQDEMSRTVDKIGGQLNVRTIFNALLDKADENDVDARMVIDGARRNPIALGMIAVGAIWLVSDKDSKIPSIGSGKLDKPRKTDFEDHDVYHRDYVSHMSAIDMREGEDPMAYQRRRDIARANYMMIERNHDEDDSGFRQRLDDVTEKFREKRRAWSESSGNAQAATRQKAGMAAEKTKEFYGTNPLIGGLIAAAVGAAFGSAVPISRQEKEKLGGIGDKARDMAGQQSEKIGSQLREKKDELVEKADRKLDETKSSGQTGQAKSDFGQTQAQPKQPIGGQSR